MGEDARQRRYLRLSTLVILVILISVAVLASSCTSGRTTTTPAGTGGIIAGQDARAEAALIALDRDAVTWASTTITVYVRHDGHTGWTSPVPAGAYGLACGWETAAPTGPGPLCTATQDAASIRFAPVTLTGHGDCEAVEVGAIDYVWCSDRYRTALSA